jgi:hypothetical protein
VLAAVELAAGLAGLLPALFVVVASFGLVLPNATALALADHSDAAGSASALRGVVQFVCGASAAPLVGIAGTGTAVPMAVVIAAVGWPPCCRSLCSHEGGHRSQALAPRPHSAVTKHAPGRALPG